MPGGSERTKMIETNHINVHQERTDPVNTPGVTCGFMSLPIVDRIAPKLSPSAEVIGRHASNKARALLLV
jgi:hypothetical protein